jgi:hypothetical protein
MEEYFKSRQNGLEFEIIEDKQIQRKDEQICELCW